MAIRRAITVGVLLVAGIALAGCTGEPTDAEGTASPTPSSTVGAPTPTLTPGTTAQSEADAARLPMPIGEIGAWSETAVPDPDAPGWAFGLSGWLGESSGHQRSTMQSLEAGAYQAHIACRGDGTVTATIGELDGEGDAATTACTNGTIAIDVTTTRTGLQVLLDLEGAPSVYAVSLLRVS